MSKGTRTASWLGDHSPSIDLRRTIDDRTAERILARSGWLAEPERSMVVAVFGRGLSASAVARVRKDEPRIVRRCVAKAAARVLDARAAYVAERSPAWPPARARVAKEIFHHGCSLRETARRCALSLYTVRVHRDAIEGMFDADRKLHAQAQAQAQAQSQSQPNLQPHTPDRSWR